MTLFVGLLVGMIVTAIVFSAYVLLGVFIFWMAVDAAKQDRFWWVVLVLGIPGIGAAVYYVTEKKHEYAKAESHHIHDSETESQHEQTPHPHHKKEEKVDVEGASSGKKVVTEEEKAA
jgi:hypothetical protein